MDIGFLGDDAAFAELSASAGEQRWVRLNGGIESNNELDAVIVAQDGMPAAFAQISVPVFWGNVVSTLKQNQYPKHVLRFNAWPGFLQRNVWEIAGAESDESKAVLTGINKEAIFVKDEPGLVSARILSMIINEAFFALGDDISSKAEIDTAMKLGTNYPMGPFDWAAKIGERKVLQLLQTLSAEDKRYRPAPAFLKAFGS